MPHYDELYPGRFLKSATLLEPRTIRIIGLRGEALEGDDGTKAKGVLRYRDAQGEGEIVWCRTNAVLTEHALGTADFGEWAGRLITIWYDPDVRFGSETVGGIRVYGSPELARDIEVGIKRPRRKKREMYRLRRTDKHGRPVAPGTAQDAPAAPAPEDVDAADRAAIEAEERAAYEAEQAGLGV